MTDFPDDIDYAERGTGPAVLFLPGSFGTGAGWKLVIEDLGERYRLVTTSLLGYGRTAERRPDGQASISEQIAVLDLIFDRIAAPVHVVGHSYGGVVALAHVLNGRHRPASLTLVEANPYPVLLDVGDNALHETIGAMTRAYFAEYRSGRVDAAERVIDFYGGPGTFQALPQKVRDFVIATTRTNIRDWASVEAFNPTVADFAAISVPALVIHGGDSPRAMCRISELLAEHLADAHLVSITGASHFLPATHPGELARLIADHIAQMR